MITTGNRYENYIYSYLLILMYDTILICVQFLPDCRKNGTALVLTSIDNHSVRVGTTDAPRLCISRIREKFALVSCIGFPRNVMENFWIVGGKIYMIYYNGYTDFRT